MVEINLSSNAIILGVHGKNHPLATYLAAGVPVVLSTDDAGVSRINMTNEYFRAVHDQGLDYPTLKAIARNALIHSFPRRDAKSAASWSASIGPTPTSSDRVARRRSTLQNLILLIKAAVTPF